MSLAIQTEEITAVLLADGWHIVADDSFAIGTYEIEHGGRPLHSAGQNGISPVGFAFTEPSGVRLTGPLTSILAVRSGAPVPMTADGLVIPEWCGDCGGPELEKRWVTALGASGRPETSRCQTCNPRAVT